jgi:hypothetical protein
MVSTVTSSYRYTGRTPVKTGDSVNVLDEDGDVLYKARVIDALATQFTVTRNSVVTYLFYHDKGLTWKPL